MIDPIKLAKAKDGKPQKIKDLIDDRADNTCLPAFPSAQMWFKRFTSKERKALQQAVIDADGDWEDYETDMKAHWPQAPARGKPAHKDIKVK